MSEVAEVVFDLAEGLILREIDELFGHLAEDVFGIGAELLKESLNARLTVLRER